MVSNKTYVTEALILNHRDFGETDLLITLFTKLFGKVPVVARRAKMPNSKFSSGVQLLNRVQVSIGRGRNLDHMNECEIVDSFHKFDKPVLLKKFRMDPALAGGVMLTTITDVVCFVSFLGLATIFYA